MFGINWSRVIRQKTAGAFRWAGKPYRDEKQRQRLAKKRRQTWRSR